MGLKKCSTCKIEKEICEFHKWKFGVDGYRRVCKECRKNETKKYYEKNSEKIKINVNSYRIENIDKIKERNKKNYQKNREKVLLDLKKYRENNKDKRNEYQRIRKSVDPIFKLKHNMNSRLRVFLKSKNLTKKNKTFEVIGCTPKELKEHLENQFTDGMSWDKMGKEIHIDHIIPLSSAKTEEEIYKLCHYKNLQPLWAIDNMKKGDKII
jgi:hypothetical protein